MYVMVESKSSKKEMGRNENDFLFLTEVGHPSIHLFIHVCVCLRIFSPHSAVNGEWTALKQHFSHSHLFSPCFTKPLVHPHTESHQNGMTHLLLTRDKRTEQQWRHSAYFRGAGAPLKWSCLYSLCLIHWSVVNDL